MSRVVRLATLAAATLVTATLAGPATASAQSTPSFFPERYVACRETRALRPPAPSAPAPAALVPLSRRPSPPPLAIAPFVVIDVAVVEAIPARARSDAPPPPPPVLIASEDQDWRCVGFTRGKAGILDVVRAPPNARFTFRGDATSWRLLNARAASTAAFTGARAALRRMLERPIPADGRELFDALDTGINTTRALATLGDPTEAARIVERLAAREDSAASTAWLTWVEALAYLSPRAAEDYAAAVVARIAAGRAPTDPHAAADDTLLRAALPLLTIPDAARLALLRGMPGSDARCDLMTARVRLGDRALRDALRPELDRDLRTQRAVACYSDLMPVVFPGDDPDTVDVLLHRHRMVELLDLLERGAAHPGDPRWERARALARRTLESRASDPDVAADRSDRRFNPVKRARHGVALAVLGDAAARSRVEQIITDDADHGVAPFVAATLALRFGWPGAADRAAHRLAWARSGATQRYDTDLDPMRGFVRVNDHVLLVDALAARGDPRFALGLLDRERPVREATALHLARLRPTAACDVVTAAAAGAQETAVQDAFWSLTLLGDACREQAHRLATTAASPPHVRGMALELLAMMRDPRARPHLEERRPDDIRPARQRARMIFHARP